MATVRKSLVKTEKKHKNDKEEKEVHQATDNEIPNTPERKELEYDGCEKNDEEMQDSESQRRADKKKLTPRRIWGPKGSSTSSALYERSAATPQRIDKDTEESADLKKKLSKHTADKENQELITQADEGTEHQNGKWNAHFESSRIHIKWTDDKPAHQHCKTTTTIDRNRQKIQWRDWQLPWHVRSYELLIDREAKENNLRMVIKSWQKEATYEDRFRITNGLLYKAYTHEAA